MSHDHHESLPYYSPLQVLVDGCGECETRAARNDHGIGNLDPAAFARAWDRARTDVRYAVSDAERPLLDVLAAVQIQLDRCGAAILLSIPMVDAHLPGDTPHVD